jgi:transcriptional regulator with XRE-family HTH domain
MEPKDIVLALKHLGMTQVEIASAVGCSQATISDIENGKQKRPTYQMVVRLNDLLAKKQAESIADGIKSTDDVQVPTGGRSDRRTKEAKMASRGLSTT